MADYMQHLRLGNIILSGILVTRFTTRKGQKAESKMNEENFLVFLKKTSSFQIIFPCLCAVKAPLLATKKKKNSAKCFVQFLFVCTKLEKPRKWAKY